MFKLLSGSFQKLYKRTFKRGLLNIYKSVLYAWSKVCFIVLIIGLIHLIRRLVESTNYDYNNLSARCYSKIVWNLQFGIYSRGFHFIQSRRSGTSRFSQFWTFVDFILGTDWKQLIWRQVAIVPFSSTLTLKR